MNNNKLCNTDTGMGVAPISKDPSVVERANYIKGQSQDILDKAFALAEIFGIQLPNSKESDAVNNGPVFNNLNSINENLEVVEDLISEICRKVVG